MNARKHWGRCAGYKGTGMVACVRAGMRVSSWCQRYHVAWCVRRWLHGRMEWLALLTWCWASHWTRGAFGCHICTSCKLKKKKKERKTWAKKAKSYEVNLKSWHPSFENGLSISPGHTFLSLTQSLSYTQQIKNGKIQQSKIGITWGQSISC